MYRKVEITIKYVPTAIPANKNPSYDVLSIEINEKYLKEKLVEGLSLALAKVIQDGEKKSEVLVA